MTPSKMSLARLALFRVAASGAALAAYLAATTEAQRSSVGVGPGLGAALTLAAVYLLTGGHYTCYLLWHTLGRDMR